MLLFALVHIARGADVVVEHAGSPRFTAWDESEPLFDESIRRYDIELSPLSEQKLRDHPYEWVPGALIVDGMRFEPVGVRIKGQNSFQPYDEKPSLKVKLDHFVPGMRLRGLEELTFQNMDNDATLMHERVAYRFFREAGFAAARAAHSEIWINNAYRGLYTHVESVDENLLAQYFADPSGSLFELWDVELTDYYVPFFQLEEGPDDRTALQGLADALELGGSRAIDAADPYTDVQQFARYVAACAVVGQFDSYPWRTPADDTHLYVDPLDGRIRWMPHGIDETFYSPDYPITDPPGFMAAACMNDPGCAQSYADQIWELQALAEERGLLAYAVRVRGQTEAYIPLDPFKSYTDADVYGNRDAMLWFIADRRAQLGVLLGDFPD